jgi:hypothetical protein
MADNFERLVIELKAKVDAGDLKGFNRVLESSKLGFRDVNDVIKSLGKKLLDTKRAFLEAKEDFEAGLTSKKNVDDIKNYGQHLYNLVDTIKGMKKAFDPIRNDDPFRKMVQGAKNAENAIENLTQKMKNASTIVNWTYPFSGSQGPIATPYLNPAAGVVGSGPQMAAVFGLLKTLQDPAKYKEELDRLQELRKINEEELASKSASNFRKRKEAQFLLEQHFARQRILAPDQNDFYLNLDKELTKKRLQKSGGVGVKDLIGSGMTSAMQMAGVQGVVGAAVGMGHLSKEAVNQDQKIKNLNKSWGSFGTNLSNAFQQMHFGAIAFGAITYGIQQLGSSVIKVAADFEQYRMKLTAVTGSAEEAAKMMEYMKDYAAKTPFEVKDLV